MGLGEHSAQRPPLAQNPLTPLCLSPFRPVSHRFQCDRRPIDANPGRITGAPSSSANHHGTHVTPSHPPRAHHVLSLSTPSPPSLLQQQPQAARFFCAWPILQYSAMDILSLPKRRRRQQYLLRLQATTRTPPAQSVETRRVRLPFDLFLTNVVQPLRPIKMSAK